MGKPIPVELPEGFEETVEIELEDDDLPVAEPLPEEPPLGHSDNLAEILPEDELKEISLELISKYDEDKSNREEWERAYTRGLDLLGFKREERTKPWAGACGVTHPLLAEAVVMFQAQSTMEIFPAAGPCRAKIIGIENTEKKAQAKRVVEEMNFFLTEKMTEYRAETEQLLFQLPLAGSAFKKIYFHPPYMRPVSVFVPAEDFVVPYGASDLVTCHRYTHVMRKYPTELQKLQATGFYSDIEVPEPGQEIRNDVTEKKSELEGEGRSVKDERHTILEMHVDYDFGVDEAPIDLPYVVTIDYHSGIVLSIRRNWREGDPNYEKRMHFVHYSYIPGMGFYGVGLIQLIGGITASSTSILRQLVDAGTLSNLPGGLKTRGLRVKGDDTPITPGEFRDVDVPAGKISENISFLPYKEPSAVLFNLLNSLVDEGRRVGSIADMKMADTGAETPVGTTLAILERATKVMSAVHARLHDSLKGEMKILTEIIHTRMPPKYEYDVGSDADRSRDFDGRVDVIPVSDPNSATMAQRQVQYQAALTMATQAPDIYDMKELHREALQSLGLKNVDKIVPPPEEAQPLDPVAENMNIITNKPIRAFPHQDHKAHMEVHLNATKDPRITEMLENSPNAPAIMGAFEAHIAEHMAMQYRREIEEKLGVALPPPDEQLPPDIENDVARLTARASKKVLEEGKDEVAKQQAEEAMKDPVTQIAMREQDMKEEELAHDKEIERDEIEIKREELDIKREKIQADKQVAGLKTATDHLDKSRDRSIKKTEVRNKK